MNFSITPATGTCSIYPKDSINTVTELISAIRGITTT